MNFSAFMPKIDFGDGKLERIGEITKPYGKKAMITIDPFLEKAGIGDTLSGLLKKSGIDSIRNMDIQSNPDCYAADKCGQVARESRCDVVIAVGGGSAMDYGKAVAVVATNPGESWAYTRRSDHKVLEPSDKTLPVITVPTTAGTGSEATTYSVLNNTRIHEKSTIVSEKILPKISIVDPLLMASMPAQLTAHTGIDALAHAVESYINITGNPFNRMLALEAIQLISQYLPMAVANGQNRVARAKMAWASTLAGAAIAFVAPTLPHAMGQAVGGFKNAPHGGTLTACLVKVLEISFMSDPPLFADIAEAMDPEIRKLSVRDKAELCPKLVARLLADTGTHVKYSDFGLRKEDIPRVTQIAFTGYGADIAVHPKRVSEEDVKKLYEECL